MFKKFKEWLNTPIEPEVVGYQPIESKLPLLNPEDILPTPRLISLKEEPVVSSVLPTPPSAEVLQTATDIEKILERYKVLLTATVIERKLTLTDRSLLSLESQLITLWYDSI